MKATILLVEDSKLQQMKNESLLHKAGYNTLHARDGDEALRVAREKAPDLILLDMLLPKLSGPEVLKALKQDPATARIPVIVLSSMAQSNEAKLRRAGAANYFEKSRLTDDETGPEALVDMVGTTLRQATPQRAAAGAGS